MENKQDLSCGRADRLSAMDAVRRMAAGISHDLNNILTGILGFTALMLYDLKEGDPLYALCKEIEKSGNDAKALSEKLMILSRRERPAKTGMDLAKIVEEAAELLENSLAGRVSISADIKNTGLVPIDRDRLLAALELILHKIAQHLPSGSGIRMVADVVQEAGTLKKGVIIVECASLEIDNNRLSSMFTPYYSSSRDKLLGFELVVAAEVVADHGGKMLIEPNPSGKGIKLRLELPV